MLEVNPEYLLLFHECENAGFSSPSPPSVSSEQQQQQRLVIEVVEVEQ